MFFTKLVLVGASKLPPFWCNSVGYFLVYRAKPYQRVHLSFSVSAALFVVVLVVGIIMMYIKTFFIT